MSLQIGTRQSEDLDFMKWRTCKSEKMEVLFHTRDTGFDRLQPVYSVTAQEIEEFIKSSLL